jgi:predicted ArsR family transcriptional regulator
MAVETTTTAASRYAMPGTLAHATLTSLPATTSEVAARTGAARASVYAALARHRTRGLVAVAGYRTREGSGPPDTVWRITPAGRAAIRRPEPVR